MYYEIKYFSINKKMKYHFILIRQMFFNNLVKSKNEICNL